jgi:hypothetical protein
MLYRISWENVKMGSLRLFSDTDPLFFKNTKQTVPNSQIPDEHWDPPISRETGDPWQQYNQLRAWEKEDVQYVRRVRLEKVAEIKWEEVVNPDESVQAPEYPVKDLPCLSDDGNTFQSGPDIVIPK